MGFLTRVLSCLSLALSSLYWDGETELSLLLERASSSMKQRIMNLLNFFMVSPYWGGSPKSSSWILSHFRMDPSQFVDGVSLYSCGDSPWVVSHLAQAGPSLLQYRHVVGKFSIRIWSFGSIMVFPLLFETHPQPT